MAGGNGDSLKLVRGLSIGYGAFLLLLLALWWTVGDTPRVVAWLHYVPPILYGIPPLVLLGVSALSGFLIEKVINGVVLLLIPLLVMPLRLLGLRSPDAAPPGGAALKVLTFDAQAASYGPAGALAVIHEAKPDVVFLQEADDAVEVRLHKTLRGWDLVRGGDRQSLCILAHRKLERLGDQKIGSSNALLATLEAADQTVTLINVDLPVSQDLTANPGTWPAALSHTVTDQREEADALVSLLGREPEPVILAGNLNSPPGGYVQRSLTNSLTDTFDASGVGYGLNLPSLVPLWRLDYILVSPHVTVESAAVLDLQVSNHKPLLSVVAVPPLPSK